MSSSGGSLVLAALRSPFNAMLLAFTRNDIEPSGVELSSWLFSVFRPLGQTGGWLLFILYQTNEYDVVQPGRRVSPS